MNHEASYVVGRVSRDAAKMKKKQNEGEASERCRIFHRSHQWGYRRPSAAAGALFSPPRKHHFEVYLLAASSVPSASFAFEPRSSSAFCAVLFLISLRSSSRAIALSRENPPSFRAVSLSSLYSLSFAPSPALFSKAKGRDPERRLVINMIPESDTRKPLIIQAGANGTRYREGRLVENFYGLICGRTKRRRGRETSQRWSKSREKLHMSVSSESLVQKQPFSLFRGRSSSFRTPNRSQNRSECPPREVERHARLTKFMSNE